VQFKTRAAGKDGRWKARYHRGNLQQSVIPKTSDLQLVSYPRAAYDKVDRDVDIAPLYHSPQRKRGIDTPTSRRRRKAIFQDVKTRITGSATRECDAKWLKAVSEACRVRLLSREILKPIKRPRRIGSPVIMTLKGASPGTLGPSRAMTMLIASSGRFEIERQKLVL